MLQQKSLVAATVREQFCLSVSLCDTDGRTNPQHEGSRLASPHPRCTDTQHLSHSRDTHRGSQEKYREMVKRVQIPTCEFRGENWVRWERRCWRPCPDGPQIHAFAAASFRPQSAVPRASDRQPAVRVVGNQDWGAWTLDPNQTLSPSEQWNDQVWNIIVFLTFNKNVKSHFHFVLVLYRLIVSSFASFLLCRFVKAMMLTDPDFSLF